MMLNIDQLEKIRPINNFDTYLLKNKIKKKFLKNIKSISHR